jgi:uncharacterized repeat protein (TIGR02543 family)
MKKRTLFSLAVALTAVSVMVMTGCENPENPKPGDKTAVFTNLTANGSNASATTKLTLFFDRDITDLSAADITLSSGSTGTSKGTLTKTGTGVYDLAVSGITSGGSVSVAVSKSGYNITGGPKSVAVYRSAPVNITVTFTGLTADGSATVTTTKLTLTFDKDITGLSAADIALDGGSTGASKGSLTKTGTGVYDLAVSGITSGGSVSVSVSKSGYNITGGTKSVTVYYGIIAAIQGITIPVNSAIPVTTITETAQYRGTITWSPADNPFKASTEYTATITLTAKTGYTLQGVAADFFTVDGATSVSNTANSGVIIAQFPSTSAATVNISAIQGVTAPVNGAIPVTTITGNAQYSGTIAWNGNPSRFAALTVYTATITLTPKTGYTLQGVIANSFTVAGAVSVNNDANSGVITVVFPQTAATVINAAAIPGVTAPVTGETPVTAITENEQYTGTVEWSPNHSTFAAVTRYTATITLTPKTGYTLQGVARNLFTVAGATVSNAANSGVITAVFPQTAAIVVNITAIQGVTVPVTDGIRITTVTENEQYTGTVTWSPNHSTFAAATQYTATITLTAKTGYTLQGVAAGCFTVAGAASVSNSVNSGIITAVFPQTNAVTSSGRFEYYWVDRHGSLVTTSGGTTTIAAGETLTITAQGTGYDVKQWYLDSVNTGQNENTYDFSSTILGKHTVGLFVEKDGRLYNTNITINVGVTTITFSVNGGAGTPPVSQTVITGSSITIPSGSGLTRIGYTFGGWNTNASGTGTNYNEGVSYTVPTSNVTLYARWITNVTVTFNINSGTGTAPASQTVPAGSGITLPSGSEFSRTGYTFGGWNTNASGTGTNYSANSSYTPTGNITLYAKWNVIQNGSETYPYLLTSGTWENGNITSNASTVWYSFSVTNGTIYYVWWNDSYQGNSTKNLDVKVNAKYSNGTAIFTEVDSAYNSAQSFIANQTGTVKIKVSPYSSGNIGTFGIVYSTDSTRP